MDTTMNGKVAPFERNHYFYGKLMDVTQFEKEQRYFNHKRLLLNRHGLGSGIVCGLNVVPGDEGAIIITKGFAIDEKGREIVILQDLTVDPHRLTDEHGVQMGEPIEQGSVNICLAYAETKADPVPVLVPDCDTPGNCAHSTVLEGFRILIQHAEVVAPAPPACQLGGFPLPADGGLHTLLCDRIGGLPLEQAAGTSCLVLARVTLPLGDNSIDIHVGRRLIYSNALLYELILCLSERVEKLAQGWTLRYVSGDGQTGPFNTQLNAPLVVEVVDGEGNAVEGVLVQFTITASGGAVTPTTATTDQQGRAQTEWVLGSNQGEQTVTASAVGTAFTITFRATALAS